MQTILNLIDCTGIIYPKSLLQARRVLRKAEVVGPGPESTQLDGNTIGRVVTPNLGYIPKSGGS